MTAIVWGKHDNKTYFNGIDRGVVYTSALSEPWDGLVSVENKSTGGDIEDLYLDGIRRGTLTNSEFYSATIKAFSTPSIVESAIGNTAIGGGLFAETNIRKVFSMSYRSFIGNGRSSSVDYRIHFLYNLSIKKPTIINETRDDDSGLDTLTYDVSSSPDVTITAQPPFYHLYVDTRSITSTAKLTTLENFIYGTSSVNPSMPTALQLKTMLA